jgi:tRNA U34 2-thiouridine synthase MnmA/TrmU
MNIRHGPRLVEGSLTLHDDDDDDSVGIKLDQKDSGLAPGQYVVFTKAKNALVEVSLARKTGPSY